ncbi:MULTISPECIES: helix-turn-helix domain-containing protein [unclassified Streptomyces]|uniref:TetR/AcrR family transcriptional regulator n=1 Tax=unclassified Streptomyces TaxID=2593676 RepID=UPI0033FFB87C
MFIRARPSGPRGTPGTRQQGSPGRSRAAARRNRDQFLEAALVMLPKQGSQLSLEAVAHQAGVSIATLHRHFPTPDALILAVHRQETAYSPTRPGNWRPLSRSGSGRRIPRRRSHRRGTAGTGPRSHRPRPGPAHHRGGGRQTCPSRRRRRGCTAGAVRDSGPARYPRVPTEW